MGACEARYIEYFPNGSEYIVTPVRFVCHTDDGEYHLHNVTGGSTEVHESDLHKYSQLVQPVNVRSDQIALAIGREIDFLAWAGRSKSHSVDVHTVPQYSFRGLRYSTAVVPRRASSPAILEHFIEPVKNLFDALVFHHRQHEPLAENRWALETLLQKAAQVLTSSADLDPMERAVRDTVAARISGDPRRIELARRRALLDELNLQDSVDSYIHEMAFVDYDLASCNNVLRTIREVHSRYEIKVID